MSFTNLKIFIQSACYNKQNLRKRTKEEDSKFILKEFELLTNEKVTLATAIYCSMNNILVLPRCNVCNTKIQNTIIVKGKVKFSRTCSAKCKHIDPISKENVKKNCLLKYGVTSTNKLVDIQEKQKYSKIKKYGNDYDKLWHKKVVITMDKKYGEYYNKTEECKIRMKELSIKKYGTESPNQISEIHEKQQKYRWKDYALPSGKIIKIQGYEGRALDDLLTFYSEDEIITQRKDIPKIWYFTEDGKKHRYFADIWIPKDNLIIEVKSTWTLEKYLSINKLKEKYTISAGYNFNFMVYSDKILLTSMPKDFALQYENCK